MKKILILVGIFIAIMSFVYAEDVCVDTIPPDAPGNLQIASSPYDADGDVTLTWSAAHDEPTQPPCDDVAKYYNIYRSTDNTNFVKIAKTSSLSFSDRGLTQGLTYYYQVTAIDSVIYNPNEGSPATASTTIGTAPPTTSTSGSSGGGGGGGGGGAAPALTSLEFIDGKIIFEGKLGETARFMMFGNSNTVRINKLTSSSAQILVKPGLVFTNLDIGNSEFYDLNEDGRSDIKVTLTKIEGSTATLVIVDLSYKPPEDGNPEPVTKSTGETSTDLASEKDTSLAESIVQRLTKGKGLSDVTAAAIGATTFSWKSMITPLAIVFVVIVALALIYKKKLK